MFVSRLFQKTQVPVIFLSSMASDETLLLGAEHRWVKQGLALCLTVAMEKIASFTGTP